MREELIRPKPKGTIVEIQERIQAGNSDMDDLRILHHMERYQFSALRASQLFDGDNNVCVLDVGCGLGYGMEVFMQHVDEDSFIDITGIDIDEDAIKNASLRYPDFDFMCDDVCLMSEDKKYDVVMFFEVLGNENIKDDVESLSKLKNILSDNGIIIISIPNYGGQKPKEYFTRLYNDNTFKEIMINTYVDMNINLFGQLHPINRGNVDCRIIDKDLYETGNFMVAVIGGSYG